MNHDRIAPLERAVQTGLYGSSIVFMARNYTDTARDLETLKEKTAAGGAEAWLYAGMAYIFGYGVRQNYLCALSCFQKAALQGDVRAQCNLGVLYSEGWGTTRDEELAVGYYRTAAEADFPPAQYRMGLAYDFGKGVKKDIDVALDWYNKSAQNDYAPAQDMLGFLYEDIDHDTLRAIYWYMRAAEQGEWHARDRLKMLRQGGKGRP